jgi:hypothetical protein
MKRNELDLETMIARYVLLSFGHKAAELAPGHRREIRRAFVAGVSTLLKYLLTTKDEEDNFAENISALHDQIAQFWEQQVKDHQRRNN